MASDFYSKFQLVVGFAYILIAVLCVNGFSSFTGQFKLFLVENRKNGAKIVNVRFCRTRDNLVT